jgi:Leucine-rich repeat (LRR) protein
MSTPSPSSSSTVVGEDITTQTQKKKQKLEDEKELEDLNQQRQWLFDTMLKISLNNNIEQKEVDLSLLMKLDLPNCGIKTLPECLPKLCPNLSILFLSKNKFVEVPAIIGSCLKLQMISLDRNSDVLITKTRPYRSAAFPHSKLLNVRPIINDDAINPA